VLDRWRPMGPTGYSQGVTAKALRRLYRGRIPDHV